MLVVLCCSNPMLEWWSKHIDFRPNWKVSATTVRGYWWRGKPAWSTAQGRCRRIRRPAGSPFWRRWSTLPGRAQKHTSLAFFSIWSQSIRMAIHRKFYDCLQSQIQLLQRPPHFFDQHVHPLTLLETHQDVGAAFRRLRHYFCQVELLRELLQDVIQDTFNLKEETFI